MTCQLESPTRLEPLEPLARAYLRCPGCTAAELHESSDDPDALLCGGCGARFGRRDGILDLAPPEDADDARSDEDATQAHYWEEEEDVYRPYDHVVARGFARQRAEFVRANVPFDEIDSAIDVGAGNGMSTHCLEDDVETIFSLDYSRRLLTQSPARLRMRGDAYRLPFRDNSVDLVYSWELLHHVHQPRTVLAEMCRVARKYVYFFEPNRWNPAQIAFATVSKHDRACLRNSRGYFATEIAEAGLEIVRHRCVGWFTPNVPPVWLYRVLEVFPFEMPGIGLSHFFLLRCPDGEATGDPS